MIKKQYTEAITFFREKLMKTFVKCVIIFLAVSVASALAVKIIGLDRIELRYLLNWCIVERKQEIPEMVL